MPFEETETLIVLLFRLKLVKVQCHKWSYLTDLLDQILQSKEHDIPQQIRSIMATFRPRHLRYFTLYHPHPIHNLTDVPSQLDPANLAQLHTDQGFTTECTNERLPDDGTCLNLVVEEPLSITEVEGNERFRSREIILFLRRFDAEIYPRGGKDLNLGSGWIDYKRPIWCKLVSKREFRIFQDLRDHDPGSHHVASMIIEPYSLPTGDYLITIPYFGRDLGELMLPDECSVLAGPVILKLAQQLCHAVAFLHSHNMFHLDIKPQNLALDVENGNELYVIDLGWVVRGRQPCYLRCATGTYDYSPPEVLRWHEWEEVQQEDPSSKKDTPPPKRFNPRKVDAWAVGHVLLLLISAVLEDEELYVDSAEPLWDFGEWMTKTRPTMEEAVQRLNDIIAHPDVSRTPSPADSAIHISSP